MNSLTFNCIRHLATIEQFWYEFIFGFEQLSHGQFIESMHPLLIHFHLHYTFNYFFTFRKQLRCALAEVEIVLLFFSHSFFWCEWFTKHVYCFGAFWLLKCQKTKICYRHWRFDAFIGITHARKANKRTRWLPIDWLRVRLSGWRWRWMLSVDLFLIVSSIVERKWLIHCYKINIFGKLDKYVWNSFLLCKLTFFSLYE